MKRHTFLRTSLLAGTGLLLSSKSRAVSQSDPQPKLDAELVQSFVGAGHSDMDKVKKLLGEHPTLLNAAHDWGGGDFETCLGAASHVGFKELVRWLLDQGAQANLFTAALFGEMAILRPFLETFPSSVHAKGPHGFTLLHHAERGGDEAMEVKDYLRSLGARETKIPLY